MWLRLSPASPAGVAERRRTMKARIFSPSGQCYEFLSVSEARKHINKNCEYLDIEGVRVFRQAGTEPCVWCGNDSEHFSGGGKGFICESCWKKAMEEL